MKNLLKAVLPLCLVFGGALAFAEEDEGTQVDDFQGRIDYVDLNKRRLVIDDWSYRLALDLKVYEQGRRETDFALKEGRQVKFELNSRDSVITNIWLLEQQ
jgi:hypothetical protein